MSIRLLKTDELICCTDQPLSNFEQKLFTKLFQPILSISSYNLYLSLHSLINYGELESKKITIEQAINKVNLTIDEFISSRIELEALGLVDTYVLSIDDTTNLYMLILKRLPLAYEFFNNEVYSSMLKEKVGKDEYFELLSSYLIHLHDIHKFDKISKTLDEVYVIQDKNNEVVNSLWINTNNLGGELSNSHFDYELFVILVSAQNLLPKKIIESTTLYNNINRLAWIFSLDTEKIVDALKLSIENNDVNYDLLRTNCKKMIDKEELVVKKIETENVSNNEVVNLLNKITPSQLVENRYNTKLTPSEIEMFDKILVTTNITPGILNVLIIYVIDNKNGEIPSYNYFLKIINTWIRKGVKNTTDALNLISAPSSKSKPTKPVSSWYHKYMEDLEKKKEEENDASESLAELESFFNGK